MILKLILVAFMAIFKAIADTITHHEGGILFRKYGSFFDMKVQGKFLPFTEYPLDGWHLANTGFWAAGIAGFIIPGSWFDFWLYNYVLLVALSIVVFNIFYNKILK